MKLEIINEEEFKTFSENIACKNFFQTTMMLDRYKIEGIETYLVGLKKDNDIVAATLLMATKSIMNKKIFNAYKGPLLDYNNSNLLKIFLNELKKFVKAKDGYLLYIDPYIVSQQRDTDGNIVPDGINNLNVKNELINLGCKYIGEYTQVKWNYCLDINGLSKEELFKTFKPNTRNNINKTLNKYLLNVRKLDISELNEFKQITEDTCKRRGFKDKSLEYYQNMFKTFKDQVVYYICELDIPKYINNLENENKELVDKINELSDSSSNRNKKISMQQEIDGNIKRINEAKDIQKDKGNILPLSCAMFILFGNEIVYLFSGSYDEYMNFNGQYRLQWEIISYAADNNYQRYNFYGIKDLFNKDGKDYGVYEFKKGFNGYVEELLGTFCIPVTLLGKVFYWYKKYLKK